MKGAILEPTPRAVRIQLPRYLASKIVSKQGVIVNAPAHFPMYRKTLFFFDTFCWIRTPTLH